MTPQVYLYLVPEDKSCVQQNTVIWIITSMFVHASHWVVHGDEYFSTQCTAICIIPSTTLHVPLCVVPGDKFLATKTTPFQGPQQPNFTPFGGPLQLLIKPILPARPGPTRAVVGYPQME